MTDSAMSPAQKIRKALAERYCCEPDDIPVSMFEMESVACIVLRVAADELGYHIVYDDGEPDYKVDVADLLAIAAELEAQP